MFKRLPSLTGLRAFEAAVRLGSFKAAADELGVTPAAVGAQIQSLEARLGNVLFAREHRKVIPTVAALHLQAACHKAFSELSDTVTAIESIGAGKVLTLAVGTLFASRWLSVRLSQFWRLYPELALRLVHNTKGKPVSVSIADAAIMWGNGDWPEHVAVPVLRPHLVPVASRDYLERRGRPKTPTDLCMHSLIHEVGASWSDWFALQGVEAGPRTGATVQDGVLALQLALDGQGVALGVTEFLQNEFASGKLLPLFPPGTDRLGAYYVVVHRSQAELASVAAFRQWVLTEAQCHEPAPTAQPAR